MTYPPNPQQPGGDGYQHPENDYGGYANPQYQQQQYSGMPGPGGTSTGTGKLDMGSAISFGFKAVFQQPGFWIGMTLLMGLITFFIGLIVALISPGPTYDLSDPSMLETGASGPNIPAIVGGILGAVLFVFGVNAALKYIDNGSVSVSEMAQNPKLGLVMGIQAVISLLGSGLSQLTAGSITLAFVNLAVYLVMIFIAPFFFCFFPSLLDGRGSVSECLSLSINYGRSNYGSLLGLSIVMALIMFAATLPCGLGLIVAFPALFLTNASAYRQVSGGLVRSL